jgi:alpha-L-fucosidase
MDAIGTDMKMPESEFNVAVANAMNAHNLRVGIHKAIWEKNWDAAAELLSSLSSELKAWYSKKKDSEQKKKLAELEKKVFIILDGQGSNKNAILRKELRVWRDYTLQCASEVWFNKEKTNIYGDDGF